MQVKKWYLLIVLLSFFSTESKMTETKMSKIKEQLEEIAERNKTKGTTTKAQPMDAKVKKVAAPEKIKKVVQVKKAAQAVVKKPKAEDKEAARAAMPLEDYLYRFYFTLDVDPKLVPERVEGQFSILPRLVFSFLDEKGNLASPRFGEYFQVSPGKTGYMIETTSRGSFYIRYADANINGEIKTDDKDKFFPIKMEEIIFSEENKSRTPNLDLKGFGPFYIKPDEFEVAYAISIDETPQGVDAHPEGIFHYKNFRISPAKLED
ncbi:MAG TPA: hypothetical protein QGF02_00925 [Candidatus Babeliales bacterium]|nr:hypothetical protein [Candidatus Babeliales bacterium]